MYVFNTVFVVSHVTNIYILPLYVKYKTYYVHVAVYTQQHLNVQMQKVSTAVKVQSTLGMKSRASVTVMVT